MEKLTNDKIVEVAYCRVSTESESQTNSYTQQIDHYQKLFKANGNTVGNCGALYEDKVLRLTNDGIYADEGISGAKAHKNREAFMRMIEDAKAGLFNKINCKNIYRFSRDVEAGAKFIKDLREIGVEVFFEDGALSTANPTSNLVINMLLSVGEEESRAKSAAIQWGIKKKQHDGRYHAKPSYGYDLLEGGYLIINETESEIIKNIYKWYLEDEWGQAKIARELINNDIPTKRYGKWSGQHIKKILQNEIYIGKQITNKQRVDASARFIKKDVPKEKQIVNYYEELQIIDDDTFRRVQEKMQYKAKEHKSKGYKSSNTHILSNLIKCGNCGGGYGRKKRKGYVRKDGTSKDLGYEWVCKANDNYGKGRCDHRNAINEEELLQEIKEKISEFQKDKSSIYRTKNAYLEMYYNAQSRLKKKEDYENQLDKLNKQVKLNFELLSEGIIEKEEYRERNDKLQEDIKEINESMRGISSIGSELAKVERDFDLYIKNLNSINVDKLTNASLKKIIDKIEVKTDETLEKYHRINWKFLNVNISKLGMDMTMYAMQQDHPDKIPPEFRNQQFRV